MNYFAFGQDEWGGVWYNSFDTRERLEEFLIDNADNKEDPVTVLAVIMGDKVEYSIVKQETQIYWA